MPTENTSPPAELRRELLQLGPKREALLEMDYLTSRFVQHFHHLIIMLHKQVEGLEPVFAIDYEVLHSYLFPTLQRWSSRVPPSVAAYVLENSPIPLILPPGSVAELFQFAKRTFPAFTKFEELVAGTPSYRFSEAQKDQLVALYKRVSEPGSLPEDLYSKIDSVMFILANHFAQIQNGFKRLDALIRTGRIARLENLFPGWSTWCGPADSLMKAIQARLSARTPTSSARPDRNNAPDAQNLDVIIKIDQHQTRQMIKHRLPYYIHGTIGKPKIYCPQLVTETMPILKLDLSDYGEDTLAREAKSLRSHLDQRKHPWIVCPLGTAAIYCKIREHYGEPKDCLAGALEQLGALTDLQAQIYFSEAIYTAGRSEQDSLRYVGAVDRVLNKGGGQSYLRLRPILSRGAFELEQSFSLTDELFSRFEDGESLQLIQPEIHKHSFLHVFGDAPGSGSLDVYGVQKQSTGSDSLQLQPLKEEIITCEYTGEFLLRVQLWPPDLWSLVAPLLMDAEAIIETFRHVISKLGKADGRLVATYDLPESAVKGHKLDDLDAPQKNHQYRKAFTFERALTIKAADLVILGRDLVAVEITARPTLLSLESTVGDVHVFMPATGTQSHRVVCNTTSSGVKLLFEAWLDAGHPARLIESVFGFLKQTLPNASDD